MDVKIDELYRTRSSGGRGRFVSVVKSVCGTQLGNQLSSYAALLYFTLRHGYNAHLSPVQKQIMSEVFLSD